MYLRLLEMVFVDTRFLSFETEQMPRWDAIHVIEFKEGEEKIE
jgi:hypothetical protein